MDGLNQWAIARQFKRAIGVLLAGMLLMVSVACSAADTPMASETGTYNKQVGSKTDLRDNVQPKRNSMNGYDDDVKAGSPEVQAKARALVDKAKRNVDKAQTPKDISKKVIKSAEGLKEDVVEGAKKQKEDFVEGTQNGIENLKGNLNKASKEIPKVVNEATDNARSSVQQSADSVKGTVDTLQKNIDKAI
jgi:hypothetical protein